ncbi:MAG: hypothetical protein ACJ71J_02880 [Nitrososphaeraceae archaeon]
MSIVDMVYIIIFYPDVTKFCKGQSSYSRYAVKCVHATTTTTTTRSFYNWPLLLPI